MNCPLPSLNADFPPLTAAQIASILGKSPQAIRQQLRRSPATAVAVVSGVTADAWHPAALPVALRSRLARAAGAGGFGTVGELTRAGLGAWRPAVPLPEISAECLGEAHKLMQALLPSLRRVRLAVSQAEIITAGLDDFEKVFGHRISARHLYSLVSRTVQRDGGQNNYERLELYLPKRPTRQPPAPAATADFPAIMDAINECGPLETIKGECIVQVGREELIWERVFAVRKQLLEQGEPRRRLDRQLCDFLAAHAPSLAPTRRALRKKFLRRIAAAVAGKAFDQREDNGADAGELARQIEALPWFIPASRFFYLISNRTEDSGSMPEAVRCVISLPHLPAGWPEELQRKFLKAVGLSAAPECPAALREEILRRQKNYQALVPESVAKQIRVNPAIVQNFRSPREWGINNITAPGSQRRSWDGAGNRIAMAPGDWFGGDDATPGIAVCVPCNELATPSSEKFGVLLGRFQWLAFHDARTDKILGWDYVIRPRGSYRAEDILTGMGAIVRTHGIPRRGFQFEGGTFAANLVKQAIQLLGCEHWQTYSPRAKAIESIFSRIWTRLAVQFPHADMGRYRNENEANCHLYEACKSGNKDPRKYFPTLETVLAVINEIVAAHNAKPIQSAQYGRWVPDDFFAQAMVEKPLRKFTPDMDWMFSPWSVARTVHGMLVRCRVPMFENLSVPFEFGADWLPLHNGMKVRLHFNPHVPKCTAKVVLLQNSGAHKAGEVLGDAVLVNETASHIRTLLQVADDDRRAGFEVRQKAANFVRRETRGVGAGGRVEYSSSEQRNGLGEVRTVQRDGSAGARPDSETSCSEKRLAASLAEPLPTRAEKIAELETLRVQTEKLFT